MPRVTYEEVKEIFETNMDSDSISAMITAANVLVTNTCATSTSPALSTAELKEIERWVAAHFCCIRDPVALRAKIGDSDQWAFPASVTVAWGQGLKITVYGQQAIAMDRTGKLASTGMKQASFRASPRENSDAFTENLTSS